MFLKKKVFFLKLCNFLIILSIFMGLNSMNWLMMWMSMEMTLMFFIPFFLMDKSMMSSFSCLKYFIFQCLGSIFFIMGSLDFFFLNTFGLFIKLGLFPLHFWMFSVSKSLNWNTFFIFLTLQKVLPLMFLVFSLKYIMFIIIIILLSNSIISNLGSLNQMDLRFLMTFSSMNHMVWMIMTSVFNFIIMYMYMILYLLLIFFLYIYMKKYKIFYLFQFFNKSNLNLNYFLLTLFLIFFSFMGFPPLMGFLLKMVTMLNLLNYYYFIFFFFMLMQNLILSFSYLRVIIYLFFNLSRSMKNNVFFFNKSIYSFNILLFLIML